MSRRLARQAVMCLLYERDINKDPFSDTLSEMKDILKTDEFIKQHGQFVTDTLKLYGDNSERIDSLIEKYSIGWKIDRLSRVDISILRMAVTELLFTDTPVKVVVNEALEIAKLYSTDKSSPFINGVLASVVKEKQKNESC